MADDLLAIREAVREHPWVGHDLFPHRHEYPSASYHKHLVADFWSPEWAFVTLGFRESGKTTLAEEDIVIAACLQTFRNCVIIGAKEELAAEVLLNIKSEIENNEVLREVFPDICGARGATWTGTKIVLPTGACIQARGVGQAMRGTRHHNFRPDLVVINDFEDDEEVLTAEGRRRTLRWLLKVLLPACDRARRKLRVYDTLRDPESVPMMLIKQLKWPHRMIPIAYFDEGGREQSTWAGHPTLTPAWIEAERQRYTALGQADIWEREYMMNATAESDRTFRSDWIKIEPRVRTWETVYAMLDPARTVGQRSALTGAAVWSWVQRRLVVWEAWAKPLLPDEIIEAAFAINATYRPVKLGIEKVGLDEWLAQPIRQRQLETATVIPYLGLSAPRDKMSFIRGLQPHWKAGEIIWTQDFPDLRQEMENFTTSSRKDCLNALAYAPLMMPGLAIYPEWHQGVVVDDAWIDPQRPVWLALNAVGPLISGVLCQLHDGRVKIYTDYLKEGGVDDAIEIASEANLEAGRPVRVCLGPRHFEVYAPLPLAQRLRQGGLSPSRGTSPERGRVYLARALQRQIRGAPAVQIAAAARWTLNGLASGFARRLGPRGRLDPEPEHNEYRVVIEGLESLLGLLEARAALDDEHLGAYYRTTTDGRRYLSMLKGEDDGPQPLKRTPLE